MSREFIDAIESGDNLEAGDEFNNSISSKVGDALEFRRKEIAQTFAGNDEVDEDEVLEQSDAGHQPRSRTTASPKKANYQQAAGPRSRTTAAGRSGAVGAGGASKPKKPSKPFAKKDVWA